MLALISLASGQEVIDASREDELRKMVMPMTGYENNYCAGCIHTLSQLIGGTQANETKTAENIEELLDAVCDKPLKFMFQV